MDGLPHYCVVSKYLRKKQQSRKICDHLYKSNFLLFSLYSLRSSRYRQKSSHKGDTTHCIVLNPTSSLRGQILSYGTKYPAQRLKLS